MSSTQGRISKRYAKALFEVYDPKELESVDQALTALAKIWNEDASLRAAMLNPGFNVEEREEAFARIAEVVRPGDEKFKNFARILVDNKRVGALADIASVFSNLFDELKKLLALTITSAVEVPQDERNSIKEKLQKDFGSLVRVDWAQDAAIIGGLKIQAGDKLLDSSIAGSLDRLRVELLSL